MIGEEIGHIINLEELKEANPVINKRIILVNSSKYDDEAFEYLLDLIDESEAIAFIINERKIYTHGEYFGGDLWEDSLNYFSKYTVLNENDEITSQVYAQTSKDAIQFKGEGGITLYSDYDIHREASTIHVNYDLDAAVDHTSIVKVNDNLSVVLSVENDKIALKQYEPATLGMVNPPMLEYDNGNTTVTIPLRVDNYEKIKLDTLHVTASGNTIAMPKLTEKIIEVSVFNNTKTYVYADFFDKNNVQYNEQVVQDWGYVYGYGTTPITVENIHDHAKGIENRFSEKVIELDIKDGQYGWVVYPANVDIYFTDVENGLVGGWKKHSKFHMYSQDIEYQVYRTENIGLGKTVWRLKQKQ